MAFRIVTTDGNNKFNSCPPLLATTARYALRDDGHSVLSQQSHMVDTPALFLTFQHNCKCSDATCMAPVQAACAGSVHLYCNMAGVEELHLFTPTKMSERVQPTQLSGEENIWKL